MDDILIMTKTRWRLKKAIKGLKSPFLLSPISNDGKAGWGRLAGMPLHLNLPDEVRALLRR